MPRRHSSRHRGKRVVCNAVREVTTADSFLAAQRLLASCTAQVVPRLSRHLLVNIQKSNKKKQIPDLLTLASSTSSYDECKELIKEAGLMISAREDTAQHPLLQAASYLELARQSKQAELKFNTTLEHYQAALRALPSSIELWSEVGCFAEAFRKDKESELCLKTARDIAGKCSGKEFVGKAVRLHLHVLSDRNGRGTGVATTMGALACVEAVHNSPKNGLEILGKASKRFPLLKELAAARAYLHLKSGQNEKAEEYFAKAEGLGVVPKLRQVGSS